MANNTAFLNWDDNTEPDLLGYHIWYGLYPGIYTHTATINTGGPNPPSQATVTSFNSDGLWYFSVTAFDTSFNMGAFSDPATKRITRVQAGLRHVR